LVRGGDSDNAVESPAVCLGVVVVGAVDSAGNRAAFSSQQPYLTMAAPGVRVPTLGRVSGTAYQGSGTSQATAISSAVFALVWSKYPTATADQITARVLTTLDNKTPTRSPQFGFGLLNAHSAVTAAVPADTPNPLTEFVEPFRQRAAAKESSANALVPAPPAVLKPGSPGQFQAGKAPGLLVARVVVPAAVAVVGLVGLLVLVVIGWTARRRRHSRATPY
jgi:subtilisin family serine protease